MALLGQREHCFICSLKTTETNEERDFLNIHLQPILKGGCGQVGTPYVLLNGTER